MKNPLPSPDHGFTLAELAIVLVIVALLTTGLLTTLGAQIEMKNRSVASSRLNEALEALLGFAVSNGRLPCPATEASAGQEAFCASETGGCTVTTMPQSHGRCAQFAGAYLPGATLGLHPTDEKGRTLDSWNNPIRYAVFGESAGGVNHAYTRENGLKTAGLNFLGSGDLLWVCNAFPGNAPTSCGAASTLTKRAAAVLVSQGGNAVSVASNAEENANIDQDKFFVYHTPTQAGENDAGFDDLVVWLSPNILFNRMIAAGRLP